MEEDYIMNMKGNYILLINKIGTVIRSSMCCKKYALEGHRQFMSDFLRFAEEREDEIFREEKKNGLRLSTWSGAWVQ